MRSSRANRTVWRSGRPLDGHALEIDRVVGRADRQVAEVAECEARAPIGRYGAQGVHSIATPLKSTALLGVRIDRLLRWRNANPARQSDVMALKASTRWPRP